MTPATKALVGFLTAFAITVIYAIIAGFLSFMFPDIRFDNPAYAENWTGVKQLVSVVKALDVYDIWAMFLTAIGSVVSLIFKVSGH